MSEIRRPTVDDYDRIACALEANKLIRDQIAALKERSSEVMAVVDQFRPVFSDHADETAVATIKDGTEIPFNRPASTRESGIKQVGNITRSYFLNAILNHEARLEVRDEKPFLVLQIPFNHYRIEMPLD